MLLLQFHEFWLYVNMWQFTILTELPFLCVAWLEVLFFFMLNSAEHEILNAH